MKIDLIFTISFLVSVAYNLYEKKKGSYRRYSFWVNVFLVAVFLTFFFWFWLMAFERMRIKDVKVGSDVMFL